jgi:hypothetical protein
VNARATMGAALHQIARAHTVMEAGTIGGKGVVVL